MWMSGLLGGGFSQGGDSRRLNFEVHSFKVDHWIIEDVVASEEEARTLANKLLPNRQGVRIVREFSGSADKPPSETIIFSEMREQKAKGIVVQPVDEVGVCETGQDFLRQDSRQTISRMLRGYLEEKSLTASELLYNPAEMKRAMNFENMAPTAVSRVASLQGKATGQQTGERRDAIYNSLTELRLRAEAAAGRISFSVRKEGMGAIAKVHALCPDNPGEVDYLTNVALCRDMAEIRNLLGKVEWLLTALGDEQAAGAGQLAVIDALVADAVSFPSVIQDLLGRQPDLGSALHRLLDLLEGSFEPQPKEMAPPIAAILSRWVGQGQAPQSRQVILENLMRNLRGTAPLSYDPERTRSTYQGLLRRIMQLNGPLGGSRMVEALTGGYLRFIEQGGREGRRLCIDGILAMLETGRDRAAYLLELAGTDSGEKESDLLLARLQSLLAPAQDVNALTGASVPLKPKMQAMAALYVISQRSTLPAPHKDRFADRIDEMVADYIVACKVIEKLDDPGASLRMRATRLMQFAANDVLASPKARKMVRDQIIAHLRQPNFEGKFIEGLQTTEEQARALRTFYDLLRQAQFI
jgi:hypothetical protein